MLGLGLTKIIPGVFYAIAIIVVLVSIFYRHEFGIYLMALTLPMQSLLEKIHPYPFGKDYIDILIMAILVGWMLRGRRPKIAASPINRYVYLLIGVTFLAMVWGSLLEGWNPVSFGNQIFLSWKNFILMPIIFFIVNNNVEDEKKMRYVVLAMALGILLVGLHFKQNFHPRETFSYEHRGEGAFVYLGPNELGAFFAQNTVFLIGLFFMLKERWRYFLITVVSVALYCIVYSYSRGAYLAAGVGLVYIGIVRKPMLLLVLVIFLSLWRAVAPPSVIERIDMTVDESGQIESSAASRFDLWQQAIDDFLGSGVGIGFDRSRRIHAQDPHNMYLKLLAETGVPGLVIYVLLYVMGFRMAWRLFRTGDTNLSRGIGLGFGACILSNAVNNIFGQNWMFLLVTGYYWIVLGMVVASLREKEKLAAIESGSPPGIGDEDWGRLQDERKGQDVRVLQCQ